MRPRKWLSELLKPRAFVRSERALEGYTWDVMGSLLEFAGAEAGGTPIVLVQQYGLFELGSDMELFLVSLFEFMSSCESNVESTEPTFTT